jgi:hypothetical protein
MSRISKLLNEDVYLANDPQVLDKTWQQSWEPIVPCCKCNEPARLAFVMYEGQGMPEYISNIYVNKLGENGDFWVHDAIACAVYLCTKCGEPTAKYNQA